MGGTCNVRAVKGEIPDLVSSKLWCPPATMWSMRSPSAPPPAPCEAFDPEGEVGLEDDPAEVRPG